ncbi:MAG: ABC transporter [Rhodobiaceae bacterium]|nr:MAG: ABC transporter [Rhodobiaceae bacterium]
MIETRNIHVSLGDHAAVRDASVRIGIGEMVGFIGPNGAGKTSLLRAMLRLAPIGGGQVMLDGTDITSDPVHAHARDIAYLPQGQNVAWPLTARRLVALGRVPHRTTWMDLSAADDKAVDLALHATDTMSFADRPVNELSGGERSRVLLARVLAVEATVLLVDEPTASLDPYHQLTTMEALKSAAGKGTAVCVVLHDLNLAGRYCDRLYLMHEGAIVASGPPGEVLSDENLAAVYRVTVRRDDRGDVVVDKRLSES